MERQVGRVAQLAAAVAASCLAWLCAEAAMAMREVRRQVAVLPVLVDTRVEIEARATRELIAREAAATRGTVAKQAAAATAMAARESEAWRQEFGQRIEFATAEALGRVDRMAADIATVTTSANATIDEYRRIPAVVGQRLDPWTDCAGNGACWQAQATALLGASRVTAGETSRAMKAIREATPAIVANVDQTTANVARITKPDSLAIRLMKLAAPLAGGAIFGVLR